MEVAVAEGAGLDSRTSCRPQQSGREFGISVELCLYDEV